MGDRRGLNRLVTPTKGTAGGGAPRSRGRWRWEGKRTFTRSKRRRRRRWHAKICFSAEQISARDEKTELQKSSLKSVSIWFDFWHENVRTNVSSLNYYSSIKVLPRRRRRFTQFFRTSIFLVTLLIKPVSAAVLWWLLTASRCRTSDRWIVS